MKWVFYVIVFVYMFYRAVYGAKAPKAEINSLSVETINYGDKSFFNVGDRKSVNCKASNRNQKVEWFDPNGNVVKRVPTNRVFAQEHFVQTPRGSRAPALVLTFTNLLVRDSGIYECRSGDSVQNASLCVIDPADFVNTPQTVTADIGRSITLSCQAKGDPEPRLVWTRNGETISDDDSSSKYRVMTKYNSQGFEGLLTITSLNPEDSGEYHCDSLQENLAAEACAHVNSVNISLNINYAPEFEGGNDTEFVYGRNNQGVELVCSASGYPKPSYRWFRDVGDDTLFEYDSKQITLSEEENQAVLTVTAGPLTFGQRFKCQASNTYGTTEKYFTLLKLEKPKRTSEVHFYNATHQEIYFNVTWYDDILFPIDGFDIQFIRLGRNDEKRKMNPPREADWKKGFQKRIYMLDLPFVELENDDLLVTLPDLEVETEYWVRLRAINSAGEAPWSEPVRASTSSEPEETSEETTEELVVTTTEKPEVDYTDATFYGIFFAGGIFVVAAVCMFLMRMV